MKALLVLLFTFAISQIIIRLYKKEHDIAFAARVAMALMLVFTAIGHFVFPEGMTAMIPSFLPFKKLIVVFSGILEIAFAIGLLGFANKRMIGILIITFFVLILPANIHAAINGINYETGALDGPGIEYLWFRVPLQLFFILWVYFSCINTRLNSVTKKAQSPMLNS